MLCCKKSVPPAQYTHIITPEQLWKKFKASSVIPEKVWYMKRLNQRVKLYMDVSRNYEMEKEFEKC